MNVGRCAQRHEAGEGARHIVGKVSSIVAQGDYPCKGAYVMKEILKFGHCHIEALESYSQITSAARQKSAILGVTPSNVSLVQRQFDVWQR